MSSVHRCRDNVLERDVAIKQITANINRKRVDDELQALFQMRSKHVVQIYDVLVTEERHIAIVQEFVDGKDLFDPELRPQTAQEFLKLAWQIAAGLSDIHSVGVIHRDIKPNNMKVDVEGVLKIFDFGLARNEGDDACTIGFIGTPGYAAPELFSAFPRFTPAVDTYAFGATALRLCLGELPSTLRERPPKGVKGASLPWATNYGLSTEVIEILGACLDSDPLARPSMTSVRDTLAKHLLRDRHRALVVHGGQSYFLDLNRRTVRINLGSMGDVEIYYDGFQFLISNASGDVFINNRRVTVGDTLPGACVVALGSPAQMNNRKYITFDLSHPEIVL